MGFSGKHAGETAESTEATEARPGKETFGNCDGLPEKKQSGTLKSKGENLQNRPPFHNDWAAGFRKVD
jgi:hypothetical protein